MVSLFSYSSKKNILNFRVEPEIKEWITRKGVSVDLKKVLLAIVENLFYEDEQTINGFLRELSKKEVWDFLIYFYLKNKHLNIEEEMSKLKHRLIELLQQCQQQQQ